MHKYTDAQLEWIKDNLDAGVFRDQQHFTDVFNAMFGTGIKKQALNTMLSRRKWPLKTRQNTTDWTGETDSWLKDNYPAYDRDFVRLAKDFNECFSMDKTPGCITKHLERLGVHKPRPKSKACRPPAKTHGRLNRGCFQSGKPSVRGELPVGTIRHNSDGRAFIKVKLCEGKNSHSEGGHNYRMPWWMPLQRKVWEDHFGEVPEGYIVCTLSGNPDESDIRNIGLINKRGTVRMAKNGWWNIGSVEAKRTAVQWCNLYCIAQDKGVDVKKC